jgi:glycosyltransferase involved in cell wall biosynthesis
MLADLYPFPLGGVAGGLQRHVQILAERLSRSGHSVTAVASKPGGAPHFEIRNGVNVYRFNGFLQRLPFLFKDPQRKYQPPVPDWLLMAKLKNIMKRERPDIIHAHGWALYSALPLAAEFQIPVVVTLHDYRFICPKIALMDGDKICDNVLTGHCIDCGKGQYGLLKSFFAYWGVKSGVQRLESVAKFMAVSSFVKEAYKSNLGLDNEKIVVMPNFYEQPVVGEDTSKEHELPGDFVLYVGTLMPEKGLNPLLEAFNRSRSGEAKLVVIGRKHPAYRYESTESILIIEDAPAHVLLEAYPRCRFAFVPSVFPDPCPTVAFEIMSYKKAVVASKIGGLTDIVADGETGILVPPNNPGALRDAIIYLLENPGVAEEMGQKGYERWRRLFTPEVVVPKIERIYQSLL